VSWGAGGAGRRGWLTVLASVVALTVASCSSGTQHAASPAPSTTAAPGGPAKPPPAEVALFGDSLSWEAQPYYTFLLKTNGETGVAYDSHGGTAICDWLSKMREVAKTIKLEAVDVQFSGNALTACMKGYPPMTQAYYDKYRADAVAAIDIFAPTGAHVFLVGAPITQKQAETEPTTWDRLNQIYAQLATADPTTVTYVDAGSAVEGPGHTYVETLPCLPHEVCDGPVVNQVRSNVVRAPDGAHFCPVMSGDEAGVIGGCPVYSSGAFRFANAMVVAVTVPNGAGPG